MQQSKHIEQSLTTEQQELKSSMEAAGATYRHARELYLSSLTEDQQNLKTLLEETIKTLKQAQKATRNIFKSAREQILSAETKFNKVNV